MKKYKITTFKNRFATEGTLTEKTLEEIYNAFKNKVKRTKEKYNEYVGADKNTKLALKDVGGYIGGETQGGKRTNGIRITRQLLTLDIDTKKPNILPYLQRNIYFYCIVHSTHSHSAEENRLRIIAPLSREVNEDEYQALGRRIAYSIENAKHEILTELFDETTFQANRLMFFPSASIDGEYICELLNLDMSQEDQAVIDVDKVLDSYLDKNDIYQWFKPEKQDETQMGKSTLANKNPLKAKGLVGAFNRTYTISQAIEKFLPQVYKKERNGRYTFVGGESFGGGTSLLNDTLFYSHHGTDPANLYYRNAFDLVRIHKFGSFDTGFTPEKEIEKDVLEKTESFSKMIEFCRSLPEVVEHSESNISLTQRIEQQENYVNEHWSDPAKQAEGKTEEPKQDNSKSWVVQLDGLKSSVAKLDVVFKHDDIIGNLFYFDTFRANICFLKKPFWYRDFVEGQALQDKDMAHIRVHLDKVYGIKGEKTIDDAIVVEADKIQKNKVLDFFEGLVWDKKPRIETFFQDFFKVQDNPFTKAALKHWLVGAVSRIFRAGAPMDMLLIIKGKQGIGKSLFFKKLATVDFTKPSDHLYSDTKIDFDKAKDSYEQLEGIWIYEWKELAGMNMSEQESIKAFVDKTEDKFRRSYGRRNVEIKRRVAFGGSTNDTTPLRDRTGNRRFLVIESGLNQNECLIKDEKKFTQEYRDQLLAEAIHLYKSGFDIFAWSEEEMAWWDKSNESNLAENDLLGNISSYMTMKRPRTWYSMSPEEMIKYIDDYDFQNNKTSSAIWGETHLLEIDRVCVMEIWKVALRQKDITINRYHRELILSALEHLGWKIEKTQQRFGVFGHQLPITKKQETKPSEKVEEIKDENLPF
jgi:putative DNA primase/helicase